MPNHDQRPYWQIAGEELLTLARTEAGPTATGTEFDAAFLRVCRAHPGLFAAYDQKLLIRTGEDGVTLHTINGVEIEVLSPRAAGNLIAGRVNQLTRSGQAPNACAALDIARREAPALAKILDGQ